MKTIAIIQARMGSKRLPGKILMKIEGKPAIWHLLYRIKRSKFLDKIVVATTVSKKDDILVKYLDKNRFNYFRGSVTNVLDRYYKTAVCYGLNHSDAIVRITADDILIDPEILDMTIRRYLNIKTKRCWLYVSNAYESGFPYGSSVEVFSFETLEEAHKNAASSFEKEHVTPYITNHPDVFRVIRIENEVDFSYIRLSIDFKEDLDFVRVIFRKLYNKKPKAVFSLTDIVKLLEKEPWLLKINEIHNPKIEEIRNIKEKS